MDGFARLAFDKIFYTLNFCSQSHNNVPDNVFYKSGASEHPLSNRFFVYSPQYGIDFTLKVPEDASVSGLPTGYSQAGNVYTWSGANVAGALDMVLTGGVQPNITYGHEAPPSEFPWLVVGVLVVVIVAIVVAVVVLRRR